MKQFKKIVALVMTLAMLASMCVFCVSAEEAELEMPRVAADAIVVDGVKDDAYDFALAIDCKEGEHGAVEGVLDGTVYLAYSDEYVYAFYEVYDPTVDEMGDDAWVSDCAEIFVDFAGGSSGTQYRIIRDGTLSDGPGNINEAVTVDFEGAAGEMTDGYCVEFAVPVPADAGDSIGFMGFVNDRKSGKYAYIGNGPAYTTIKLGADMVSDDIAVVYDAEPVTMSTGAAVALMPDGALEVNPDTEGVTYWFRIQGLKEPLTLSCPAMNLTTKHFDPVFIYEEDGVTNKRDEFGNKMVERDADGNVVYVGEELAADYNLSTYNHGQDGMRQASWTIDKDGDYLVYIPFKVYSLSHQFQGIDYVVSITNFSIKALNVSSANADATMQPMGVFENKLENYKSILTVGEESVMVSGSYEYVKSNAPDLNVNPDVTPNYISSEYYDPNYGYNLNAKLEDGSNDETAYDYTETIMDTWRIAYVNDAYPETVGGKDPDEVIWVTDPKGGDAAIPARNNRLYEAETVTVTFMNGEEEHKVVTVLYGDKITVTKPKKASTTYQTFKFDKWVDAEGNEFDLKNVTADATVYATFTYTFKHPFKDLDMTQWYGEAVEWALINGIMGGVSENQFAPNGTATRAMVVTILYRMQGSPSVEGMEAHPFTDLTQDWYKDAITWAYNTKVVNGMTATTFAPNGNITREQFATILYRYAKEIEGKDVAVEEGTKFDEKYTDVADISSYATDAVLWTNVKGYIGGMTATTIGPKGNATRAQIATILYRYVG